MAIVAGLFFFMIILLGFVAILYLGTDAITNIITYVTTGIESSANKVEAKVGQTICDLKITVKGRYYVASLAFVEGDFTPRVASEVIEIGQSNPDFPQGATWSWSDCKKKQSDILPFRLVLYSERFGEAIEPFEYLAISPAGRLFGEEFTWWVELHDPTTGQVTKNLSHIIKEKIPAGFGTVGFDNTFLFQDVPRKQLELWIYSDTIINTSAEGIPYRQQITP